MGVRAVGGPRSASRTVIAMAAEGRLESNNGLMENLLREGSGVFLLTPESRWPVVPSIVRPPAPSDWA